MQYNITAIQKCCHTTRPYAKWLVARLCELGLDAKYSGSISARTEDHALLIGSGITFGTKDGKKICPGVVRVDISDGTNNSTKWLLTGEELNNYKENLGDWLDHKQATQGIKHEPSENTENRQDAGRPSQDAEF